MPALVTDDGIAFLFALEMLGFSAPRTFGVKTQDC